MVPKTPAGKIVGGVCSLSGVLVIKKTITLHLHLIFKVLRTKILIIWHFNRKTNLKLKYISLTKIKRK
jgi:hypothetical protein